MMGIVTMVMTLMEMMTRDMVVMMMMRMVGLMMT